nr:drug resistance transporter, Bcr/CflA subfamily [uncultured bacterium]
MSPKFLRIAVVLGLLSAIGPFAIDMYLPALPTIGESFAADIGAVQLSLTLFFVSFGAFQLIFGPISDMYGRKLPLYLGLVLFAIGGIGCAFAPDIATLAPLTGSLVITLAGWRAVFWVVTAAAVVGLVMIATLLPETRPRNLRAGSGIASALAGYRLLLGDANFLALSFIGGFGIASFFVYLANSPFVLIEHFGLTPSVYSVFFSINAVAFIGMSQLTGMLSERFGLKRVVWVAVTGYATTMVALFAVMATGVDRLDVMAALLFVGYGFLGLVIPTTSVLAMEEHGEIAGTASALMGTLHFATGAVAIAVIGLFADGTVLPMVAGIGTCALITFILAQVTLRQRQAIEVPAE